MKPSMKRLLPVAALVLALSVLAVPVALADGGPHGGFTDTTPACAGCHRAHTGVGDHLLVESSQTTLCFSCHGSTGQGAATNVQDGVWLNPTSRQDPYGSTADYSDNVVGRGLKAGGFDNTYMNTNLAATAPTAAISTTSKHRLEASVTMWGNGATGAGTSVTLRCGSCHDPHGSGNYRILKGKPEDSGETTAVSVTDPVSKTYTVADSADLYYGESYGDTSITGLSNWCGQCHDRIHTANDPGDPYTERHKTTGSNVSEDSDNGAPACLTCHVVHGSSAVAEGFAAQVEQPGQPIGQAPYLDSSLLRVDNRGVCELCHNK